MTLRAVETWFEGKAEKGDRVLEVRYRGGIAGALS
jgi:hypothetical protein